jgi:hypothetical protein
MLKNKSEGCKINQDDSKQISQIKSKRKWKQIAKQLNQPELENEEEDEGKIIYL